jgi:hypothetical protein
MEMAKLIAKLVMAMEDIFKGVKSSGAVKKALLTGGIPAAIQAGGELLQDVSTGGQAKTLTGINAAIEGAVALKNQITGQPVAVQVAETVETIAQVLPGLMGEGK